MLAGRARWLLLGAILALAGGLVAVWIGAGRGDWPSRRTIRPPAGSWPLGLTRDGRSYRIAHDRGVTAVDLATGRGVEASPEPFVSRQCFAADGRHDAGVVGGDFIPDGTVIWADAATGAVERTFPAPNLQVRRLDLVEGERTLRAIVGLRNQDTEVITWDIATGAEARRPIRGPGVGFSRPMAFSPDGRTWAYLDKARDAIQLWDGNLDRPLGPPLRTPTTTRNLASWAWAATTFTPDGRTLLAGRSDGQVEFWDVADYQLIRVVRLFPSTVTVMHLILAPDGRTLGASGNVLMSMTWAGRVWERARHAITGEDISEATREAVLLDLATGRVDARSPGSVVVEFAPDSRSAVTLERDNSISVRPVPGRERVGGRP